MQCAHSGALCRASNCQAVNLGGAGNLIIPDGRTGTQVTSNGNVTDITTTTVSGRAGFNSFSQFQVGGGNSVDLHLPTNTDTLVNIVRDGPAVVEDTVNAFKNGTIGGNVVFSDAYGFVLGSGGVNARVAGSEQTAREKVEAEGFEFTPVETVAEQAWLAVHGKSLHTIVGKTARRIGQ